MALTRTAHLPRVILGVALLVGAVMVAPIAATAAPHLQTPTPPAAPKTSAEVKVTLAQLAISNEQLAEKYNLAQINVTKAEKAAAEADKAAVAAATALTVARHALATSLAAQYRGASFSRTAALLDSSSGQNYLEKMQSLSFLAMHQKEVAVAAGHATVTLAQAEAKAKQLVANSLALRASVDQQRAAVAGDIAKQQSLFNSLSAEERAAFLAKAAPTPTKVQIQQVEQQQVKIAATPMVSTSKGAAAAVAAALSQQGKPYQWGAAGPDSYDCSGLTMWAWGQAGVSLPHQSAEQQGLGTPVSESELQPGDLVFFGSPAYHVGIYIGNGMMVHAPTTGDVVKISPLANMSDYSGATRVG